VVCLRGGDVIRWATISGTVPAAGGRARQERVMENTPAASFAALLRQHRTASGLSQAALAERAGLSTRAVSDLERGLRRAPYRETLRMLAAALGLTAADRAALEAAVDRGRGSLSGSQPRAGGAAPTLPAVVTPLIGRAAETASLRSQLRRGEARLVTLTGPPGIGKTRLALAVAAALGSDFPDGAVFVDLAPIADPDLVATTMLQALDIHEVGGASPAERLKHLLRQRRTLLLLDNVEQVIGAAPLVGELLAACSGLSVLATSRVALRVRGEHEFPVPPLALPEPEINAADATGIEEVGEFSAVALFVARARAVNPGFALTAETAPAVVEICRRLDGLPLAIELAAARCKVLSPQAMLRRLEHRLRLLTDGARDAPERQRTLRAAIAWSAELLSPEERVLFRRLGVFVGGCTLGAAERVCAVDGDFDGDIFDGVAALVDHSLIQQRDGADGDPRFVMLETLREYALEQLEDVGEAPLLRQRHAADVLALAAEAEPFLFTAERGRWLRRLSEEQDNIRAALGWALQSGDPTPGLTVVGALWMWFLRRLLVEGRRWAEELLAHPGAGPRSAARASALFAAGHFAWLQGDVRVMRARLEECVAIRRELGDASGLGRALPFLGLAIDDDQDAARRFAEEGASLCRLVGDSWNLAIALTNLGRIEATWGHDDAAEPPLREATALLREIGDNWLLALPLNSLGAIAARAGRHEPARAMFDEALLCFRAVEDRRNTAQLLTNLGFVALAQGALERAESIFAESLVFGREHNDRFNTPACLRGLAALAMARGVAPRAARLYAAADAAFAATGARRWPAERLGASVDIDRVRTSLGDAAFAAAWDAGRRLSLSAAIAEAIA
jgi:predicted ATPase/DNA-binding XRE family transcriptional regulator